MHDETLAVDDVPAAPAAPASPRDWQLCQSEQRFEFRGNAREYFRIWIVNVALGIVTLGIYSAWASVRTRRYFYANTWLSGTPFEYSAQPLPILRGRVIAALLFLGYFIAGRISPFAALTVAGLVALVVPWLIVRGNAFRARYSSWRGLPFRFEPDFKGAYIWFLVAYLLMIPTLGLIYPWIKQRQQRWTVTRHRYGSATFDFDSATSSYYGVLFAAIGIAFALMFVVGIVMAIVIMTTAAHGGSNMLKQHPLGFVAMVYALYLPAYLVIYAWNRSRMLNLLYDGTTIARSHRLCSTLEFWALFWIYLGNLVAIIATLGLAIPWAKVRMVRYRTAHLSVQSSDDLDAFVAETQAETDIGALGAEMDGFFSIDIGL